MRIKYFHAVIWKKRHERFQAIEPYVFVIYLIKLIAFKYIREILAFSNKYPILIKQPLQSTHHFTQRRHMRKYIRHSNELGMPILLDYILCHFLGKKAL